MLPSCSFNIYIMVISEDPWHSQLVPSAWLYSCHYLFFFLFFFKSCIFTIWLIWPNPSTRIPAPGVIRFTILVDPSLFIITTYLVCPIHAWEKRSIFLEKYIHKTLFTPKLPPLGVWGHEIYNVLSLYSTDAAYQIWLRLTQ